MPASPARSSLLFLDVGEARERLKTNPWIADATVLKLYPGELQIGITEREAFALWQKDGRVSVIADDGTVLEPYVRAAAAARCRWWSAAAPRRAPRNSSRCSIAIRTIRDQVRASILVGERRWNLRLRNGLDVRLPEADVASALAAPGRARPRREARYPRHRGDRSAAAGPRDGAAVGPRGAGAARALKDGKKREEKGGRA